MLLTILKKLWYRHVLARKYKNQRAVGDLMLIGLPKRKEKTKGGIIIPDSINEQDRRASTIAVVLEQGLECYQTTWTRYCEIGDRIFINPYSGKNIPTDDDQYAEYQLRMIRDIDCNGKAKPLDKSLEVDYDGN